MPDIIDPGEREGVVLERERWSWKDGDLWCGEWRLLVIGPDLGAHIARALNEVEHRKIGRHPDDPLRGAVGAVAIAVDLPMARP